MIPPKEVIDYIKVGKKIPAIKLVRDITGMSLKDAKDYVDNLEREMKNNLTTSKRLFQEATQSPHAIDISAIDGMNGHDFEYFCADLLRKVGFSEVNVTPGSGDQGVDVLAQKDGIKYAIQCKNYASALSNTPVQEVSAGKQYYGCHVGVVLTNSTFTPGAIQLADATNVLLWDRKKLTELIELAGGLSNLGIYLESDDLDDDYEEDDDFLEDLKITINVDKISTGRAENETLKCSGNKDVTITQNTQKSVFAVAKDIVLKVLLGFVIGAISLYIFAGVAIMADVLREGYLFLVPLLVVVIIDLAILNNIMIVLFLNRKTVTYKSEILNKKQFAFKMMILALKITAVFIIVAGVILALAYMFL